MSDARDKRAAEIQDAIRQILHDWNPIGSDVPLDEYDSYVGPVYRILAGNRSEEELLNYLVKTDCDLMGEPKVDFLEKLQPIAKKLLALDVKL